MDDLEILRAACCIAGLDQEIGDQEQPYLRKLADRAGVGDTSLEAMIDQARTDPEFYEQQLLFLKRDGDKVISSRRVTRRNRYKG